MSDVVMAPLEITRPVRAIVQFGPAHVYSGMKGGEYFQVVIDPNMKSPGGDFIRFDQKVQGGEMHGWQRVAALTVCEVLGPAPAYERQPPEGYTVVDGATVTLMAIEK